MPNRGHASSATAAVVAVEGIHNRKRPAEVSKPPQLGEHTRGVVKHVHALLLSAGTRLCDPGEPVKCVVLVASDSAQGILNLRDVTIGIVTVGHHNSRRTWRSNVVHAEEPPDVVVGHCERTV